VLFEKMNGIPVDSCEVPQFDKVNQCGRARRREVATWGENRGVIAFAAWLNIAHAAVMAVMAVHLPNERRDLLIASAMFGVIGAVL
jgi:hypothetical protein